MTNLKTFAVVAATVLATATSASAYNAFPFGETFEQTDQLQLDFVRAEGAGTVEVYDYANGQRGALLGSKDVRSGVTSNVKVNLGLGANSDILAVLNVGGNEVLIKDLDRR
ncbi:hypothetical protein FHS72_002541 [Loktanella ponticola]|uniref:Uncharacterized protein n=1 Tax=Yoonia ponticola TaxID=1524255 RepID=A0A7W9F069_9RHOB|nr:hypothetical protein [Yoonia ponticola]MBB5722905.1 hypothetical protein [Yoonia ponticola]